MRVITNSWPMTRNQLKAGRLLANLGIRELGERACISPTAINQIETGKTKKPRVQTLEALKQVLQGLGVEFLPGGWVRHCGDRDNNDSADEAGPNGAEIGRLKPLLEREILRLLEIVRGNAPAANDNASAEQELAPVVEISELSV